MSDVNTVINQGIKETFGCMGRIVAKENGRVVDSGTVVFARHENIKLILTANHVISGLKNYKEIYLQIPFSTDHLVYSTPIETRVLSSSFVNADCTNALALDIGLIKPSKEIVEAETIQWFNIEKNASAFNEYFRRFVKESEGKCNIPAVMMGFPNFSKSETPATRTQVAGMIPLVVYVSHITEPPPFFVSRPSQINFEIDIPESIEDENCQNILKAFALLKDSKSPNILGGYSGGPLIYACEQGVFLIGIIKQGGTFLGGIGFATPIDTIFDYLKTTPKMY